MMRTYEISLVIETPEYCVCWRDASGDDLLNQTDLFWSLYVSDGGGLSECLFDSEGSTADGIAACFVKMLEREDWKVPHDSVEYAPSDFTYRHYYNKESVELGRTSVGN